MKPFALEAVLEWVLFASRWLLAPVYLGLVVALCALLYTFFVQLVVELPLLPTLRETSIILWLLSLIDLSLVGNLPDWIGKVDFGGMKLKLIASIAAISAIHLLEIFMTPAKLDPSTVGWLIAILLAIVFSGILLAATDYISEAARRLSETKR
jgi:uncharacterized membrane protein YqhA